MSSTQGIVKQRGESRSGRFLGDPRARRRGGRSRPQMTIPQILAWADEHRRLTGRWPRVDSEPKGLRIGETWVAIQSALSKGLRGLDGGSSLAQLLAEHRGLRGPLTRERILAWADAHHAATGQWPKQTSGRIRGAEGENWQAIDYALLKGRRGLPKGSSLARLLAESRPIRNVHTLPRLTIEQVLAWADAYHAKTGRWPRGRSGPVAGAHRRDVERGGSGRAPRAARPAARDNSRQVASRAHGAPAIQTSRPLTVDQILAWADAHHAATGHWPVEDSGSPSGAPQETWKGLSLALLKGYRGLQAGSSLARLLAERRGRGTPKGSPA